jgi:hypothetical protein
MSVLRRLGFRKFWIYEVIATTSNKGVVNSAPMGAWTKDFKTISIRVYRDSKTFRNITENRCVTLSLPEKVETFEKTLKRRVGHSKTRQGYCISGLSFIDLKLKSVTLLKDSAVVKARITGSRIRKKVRLFNRAEYLTLEYLIKKTKPKVKKKNLEELRRVVNKVAPKSVYSRIVAK